MIVHSQDYDLAPVVQISAIPLKDNNAKHLVKHNGFHPEILRRALAHQKWAIVDAMLQFKAVSFG